MGAGGTKSPARPSRSYRHPLDARLTYDDEVVVYCPECDEREFSAGGNCDFR
jgi:hypothetical protein